MWRKRSFGSQSERGERFGERMMTAVRTARKQSKNVLHFMVSSTRSHPSVRKVPEDAANSQVALLKELCCSVFLDRHHI
jgi:hypothetical protein